MNERELRDLSEAADLWARRIVSDFEKQWYQPVDEQVLVEVINGRNIRAAESAPEAEFAQ